MIRRIIGLFKKSRSGCDPEPINEDWRPGDLAECLVDRWWPCVQGPKRGDLNIVKAVDIGFRPDNGNQAFGLRFSRFPGFYSVGGFRKITPRSDAIERCESAFTKLIKKAPAPSKIKETTDV